MASNPLLKLEDFGQSIWLDFIRRGLIASGQLQRLIADDGVRGVTSNPAIFEKAIAGSLDYDEAVRALGCGNCQRTHRLSNLSGAFQQQTFPRFGKPGRAQGVFHTHWNGE